LKKKIYYWSPFLSPIATPKAVINSAYSLQKYSKNYECFIINFFGEFNVFKKVIEEKKINCFNSPYEKIRKFLPFKGKIKSRLSFIVIFILSFIPLKKILDKEKPDYLVVQLITSLPMFLLLLFDFKTKFILRISGLPRMTFFRKILWKLALKKFEYITCPTIATMEYLKNLNIVDKKKIRTLFDPIIEVNQSRIKYSSKNITEHKDYYLAVGRLTTQKNFIFLCKAFHKIVLKSPNAKLLIAGDGEDKKIINSYIIQNKLEKNIIILGHVENVFPLIANAKLFILSSLWEDPGFVLVEALFCRTLVLTSNCKTGPAELIKDKKNGYVFESNNMESFINKFNELNLSQNNFKLKANGLRTVKKFTLFEHFISFKKIIL